MQLPLCSERKLLRIASNGTQQMEVIKFHSVFRDRGETHLPNELIPVADNEHLSYRTISRETYWLPYIE